MDIVYRLSSYRSNTRLYDFVYPYPLSYLQVSMPAFGVKLLFQLLSLCVSGKLICKVLSKPQWNTFFSFTFFFAVFFFTYMIIIISSIYTLGFPKAWAEKALNHSGSEVKIWMATSGHQRRRQQKLQALSVLEVVCQTDSLLWLWIVGCGLCMGGVDYVDSHIMSIRFC